MNLQVSQDQADIQASLSIASWQGNYFKICGDTPTHVHLLFVREKSNHRRVHGGVIFTNPGFTLNGIKFNHILLHRFSHGVRLEFHRSRDQALRALAIIGDEKSLELITLAQFRSTHSVQCLTSVISREARLHPSQGREMVKHFAMGRKDRSNCMLLVERVSKALDGPSIVVPFAWRLNVHDCLRFLVIRNWGLFVLFIAFAHMVLFLDRSSETFLGIFILDSLLFYIVCSTLSALATPPAYNQLSLVS